MKIRSAECLLFVAIVTSAVVAPIRERTLPSAQTNAPVHASTDPQAGRMQTCEDEHGTLLHAACATMRSERRSNDSGDRPINRIDKPRASKLWV